MCADFRLQADISSPLKEETMQSTQENQKMKESAHLLLIYPDFIEDEATKHGLGNYSEGLASISAVLKQGGHRVSLMHLTYMPSREEYTEKLRSYGEVDVIGFSVRTTAFKDVRYLAEWTKEASSAVTVAGGYHAILVPNDVLALNGMDAVAVGEGEEPLLKLCDGLCNNGEVDYSIESMWFKRDGEIVKNPVAPLIQDLDLLPFPDYDLFDFDNLAATKMDTALVMVSRGCVFRCTYCGNSQFRNIYPNKAKYARFRSPEKAIELVKRLLEKHPGMQFINFRDAIINMFPKWFEEFIVRYRDEIGLPFTCNLRFDILTEEHVKLLKEAGCYMIDVGVESGDEEIRKKYLERNMTDEQMINSCKWFRKYGILTLTYNIVGLPYETLERALKTVKLNAKLEADRKIPNIFYPYPETKLAKIAIDGGFFDGDYSVKRRVMLDQPDFPERDVLYIFWRFPKLVEKYKRIYALPEQKAKRREAKLDKRILSPWYPRGLIGEFTRFEDWAYRSLRQSVLHLTPGLYKWLRNKKNRIQTNKSK
jgi:anaerobic magnesium-protoporphyrin IX monomethyl ester cyclase